MEPKYCTHKPRPLEDLYVNFTHNSLLSQFITTSPGDCCKYKQNAKCGKENVFLLWISSTLFKWNHCDDITSHFIIGVNSGWHFLPLRWLRKKWIHPYKTAANNHDIKFCEINARICIICERRNVIGQHIYDIFPYLSAFLIWLWINPFVHNSNSGFFSHR